MLTPGPSDGNFGSGNSAATFSRPQPRWRRAFAVGYALVAMAAGAMAITLAACEGTPPIPLAATIGSSNFSDADIGPVTFFTRVEVESTDDFSTDEIAAILGTYRQYGDVEPMWVDDTKTALDFTVYGARLEYGGSFVQEQFDLAETGTVPWRVKSARYRANLSARLVNFRFKGSVSPDVSVEMDAGDGFQSIAVDEAGTYEVLIPFSQQRRVVFFRMKSADVEQFGELRMGRERVEPISAEEYQRARREAVNVPQVPVILPEPSIGTGDDTANPQTRPASTTNGHANVNANSGGMGNANEDAPPNAPGAGRGDGTDPGIERRPRDPNEYAPMADYPPKVLTRPVPIDVHLVFDGLSETDPLVEDLRALLRPFGYQYDRFEPDTHLVWFFCRVLDTDDVRRMHHAIDAYAEQREVPILTHSRYFGIEVELVRLRGEFVTTLRGRVPIGAKLFLYVGPGEKPIAVSVDAQGRYSADIRPTDSAVYGILREGDSESHIRIDIFTGKMAVIREAEFDAAIFPDRENPDDAAPANGN